MAQKYCEFQPSEHRYKRTATLLFLDDADDKHPMPVCEVCARKIRVLLPEAILRPLREPKAPKVPASPAGAASPPPAPSAATPEPAPVDELDAPDPAPEGPTPAPEPK